jgi:hypothetical protein
VIVASENDAYAVLHKEWLEHLAQVFIRTVAFTGRVQRMMEVGYLPALARRI